jgi:hypothetical protein
VRWIILIIRKNTSFWRYVFPFIQTKKLSIRAWSPILSDVSDNNISLMRT